MKHADVSSRAEFERLLDQISNDARRANDSWNLLCEIKKANKTFLPEFRVSPDFWAITRDSLREVVGVYLGRLYQQDNSLSLGNFLLTVKKHKSYFTSVEIDQKELDKEIQSVAAKSSPLIGTVKSIRDKVVAHRNTDLIIQGRREARYHLSHDEVKSLIDRALAITGKYSRMFKSSYIPPTSSAGDFETTLMYVREGMAATVKRRKRETPREVKRYLETV